MGSGDDGTPDVADVASKVARTLDDKKVNVPVAPVVESPAERTERLAAERGVIAEARAALSAGNTGGALIALEAHRSSFTRGELAAEREALTVMALARAGRLDEAKAKAKAFSSAWPRSLFQQAVDDAVRE